MKRQVIKRSLRKGSISKGAGNVEVKRMRCISIRILAQTCCTFCKRVFQVVFIYNVYLSFLPAPIKSRAMKYSTLSQNITVQSTFNSVCSTFHSFHCNPYIVLFYVVDHALNSRIRISSIIA